MSGPSNSHSNSDDEHRGGVPLSTTEAEWMSYIEQSSHVDGRSPAVVSIFRVPRTLMKFSKNAAAYVPTRVSLGAYRHFAQLAPMEHHKPRALCRIRRRINGHHGPRDNIDFAVRARNAILQVQEVIKNNYDGKVEYEGEILARKLTLDGCFILEIMTVLADERPHEAYDPLFERKRLLQVERDLLSDILKLENQIPLIVLQKLLQLERQEEDVTDTLCKIVLRFLFIFYPFGKEKKEAYLNDNHLLNIFKQRLLLDRQGHHLLDCFRTLVVFAPFGDAGNNSVSIDVGSTGGEDAQHTMLSDGWDDDAVDRQGKRKSHSLQCSFCLIFCQLPCWLCTKIVSLFCYNGGKNAAANIPRAVDLANAGVKFRKCLGGIKNIYFEPKSATMYLPSIIVQDFTDSLFLNLMAFEQQKLFKTNHVMHYVYLMKKLMVSEEDVLLLKREGIVSNYRGTDKDVAEFFNHLGKGMFISVDFMDGLARQVMVHRKNKCNSYRAALLNDYFSTPWKTLGVVIAALLVALTIVQTIFIILTFRKS